MPNEVLEQLGGVATETPTAPDGLSATAAPPTPPEEALAPKPETVEEPPPDSAEVDASATEVGEPASEAKPELPAWASFTSTEEVLKHESFAVAKKELEDSGYERGKAENRQLQGYLRQQQNTLKSIDEKGEAFKSAWQTLVDSAKSDVSGVSLEQLREINREYKPMFEALSGAHQDGARWDGIGKVIAGLADAAKSETLGKEFAERVGQVRTGIIEEDPLFYADLATALTSSAMKPLENELVEANAKIGRLEEEMKTLTRQEKAPPPETASGGGSSKGGESAVLSSATSSAQEKSEAYKRKYGFELPGMLTRT